MRETGRKAYNQTTHRTFIRGVGWFTSIIAIAILVTACGGDGGTPSPGDTTASLSGVVNFAGDVPLAAPPGDAFDGPVPPGVRYGARIVDPGDDIGGTPIPKPGTLSEGGLFGFTGLDPDVRSYFNLRFTVDANLENDGSTRTPVSFNIPVSLAAGVASLLNVEVSRPEEKVLEMSYTYMGPDGSRTIRARLDFTTDLLTFDLDSDGLFDDLISIDTNHDTVPDNQALLMAILEPGLITEAFGAVTGIGSSKVMLAGMEYSLNGSTNIVNSYNDDPLTMAEISVGTNASLNYVQYDGSNVAMRIGVQPNPAGSQIEFDIIRDGAIEEINVTSLLVGGILYQDFHLAEITNVLGKPLQPSQLSVGDFVTVTGTRNGETIVADEIVVTEVSPPPAFIERYGPVQDLNPVDNPTQMTVTGITFEINALTTITDIDGTVVDASYLMIDYPVYVTGHVDSGAFYADVIALQYRIDDMVTVPEIVVLVNDAEAIDDVQDAIDQVQPTVSVSTVVVSSYPPSVTDPPCIEDAFTELFWSAYILMGMPGYIDAFPRVVDEQCSILVIIEDGYPDTVEWIDYFYPAGIGGAYLEYDFASMPPFYGSSSDLIDAHEFADLLSEELGSNDNVVSIYISPDIGVN